MVAMTRPTRSAAVLSLGTPTVTSPWATTTAPEAVRYSAFVRSTSCLSGGSGTVPGRVGGRGGRTNGLRGIPEERLCVAISGVVSFPGATE